MTTVRRSPIQKRKLRVRGKITGTADRPRLSVFRSHQHLYAQLIDDTRGRTLLSLSTLNHKEKVKPEDLGLELGKSALKKNINTVVFDRGSYKFHGQIKALAQGARKAGLKF